MSAAYIITTDCVGIRARGMQVADAIDDVNAILCAIRDAGTPSYGTVQRKRDGAAVCWCYRGDGDGLRIYALFHGTGGINDTLVLALDGE
jgi:hypothetical protein